jgi:hypothetical protein
MAKRDRVVEEIEEVEDDVESGDVYLYKVTFKKTPPFSASNPARVKVFITFGTSETDARDRVWNAFKGSSFHREFNLENALVDFIFGGVLKIAG